MLKNEKIIDRCCLIISILFLVFIISVYNDNGQMSRHEMKPYLSVYGILTLIYTIIKNIKKEQE